MRWGCVLACSVKAELEAQVVAEQEKHKDTHDKYERAAGAEHSHTSPHTWEQLWIVRPLRHGYESLGCAVCTVARRSDAGRRDAPPDAVGESGRDRAEQPQGHRVQSRSAALSLVFPCVPTAAQPEHRFETRRRDLSGMARVPFQCRTTCGATAKPVRACAHYKASQAQAIERAMCKESAALQASASMQLARVLL